MSRGFPTWLLGAAFLLVNALGCPKDEQGIVLVQPPPPTSDGGGAGDGGAGGEGGVFDDGCEEQPCKLVSPQCGCPIGQRCTHNSQGDKSCVAAGGKPAGAACQSDCLAGHVCADFGTGAPALCHRYCNGNADCVGDGSLCILALTGVDEMICTHACEPIGQTGCPAMGTKCDAGVSNQEGFSFCTAVGNGVQGDLCANTSECGAGLTCSAFNAGPLTCYTLCDVDNPICPGLATCRAFADTLDIGIIEYGICVE